MPNHVMNKMTISGTSSIIDELLNKVTTDTTPFDFNGIIPMPDHIYRGDLGNKELALYGKNNWYDWSVENWDTKWNAYDVVLERDFPNEVRIQFCTAWNEPYPIYFALNEQYPDLDIYIEFANEDLGNDCGYFLNGDIFEPEGNAISYAAEVWGYTEEEVKEMYGDDIYREEPEMTDHLYVICHGIEGGVYESLLNAQSKDEAIAAIKKYANSLTDDEIKQTTWLDLVYAEITEDGLPDYQNSETIYTVIREE